MSSVEDLPAFSIWKMFNDTFSALQKTEYNESSIERLANLIKSKDFSNIFCHARDPQITYENYQEIANKYTTFTTWILGRFFHLLSIEKLIKIHDLIIDVQICILDQISKTQLHVYCAMAVEYSNALNMLKNFKATNAKRVVLNVFIPKSQADLEAKLDLAPTFIEINQNNLWNFTSRVMKFFKYLLNETFSFNTFDSNCIRDLDCLLYFLSESPFDIKIEILEIFLDILTNIDTSSEDLEWDIYYKIQQFAAYFEQMVYQVYDEQHELLQSDFTRFESLILKFISSHQDHELISNICEYLLIKTSNLKPADDILKQCKEKLTKIVVKFDDSLMQHIKNFNSVIFCGCKEQILEDLKKTMQKNQLQCICLYDTQVSKTFSLIHQNIRFDNFIKCDENCCKLRDFIEFLSDLFLILVKVKIEMKNAASCVKFFDSSVLLSLIQRFLNVHFVICKNSTNNFQQIFSFLMITSLVESVENLPFYFDIFSHLITKNVHFMSSVSNEIAPNIRSEFYNFLKKLSDFNIDDGIIYRSLSQYMRQISCGFCKINEISKIQAIYSKICENVMATQNAKQKVAIIQSLPNILAIFSNIDFLLPDILSSAFCSNNGEVLIELVRVLPEIICMSSNSYVKVITISKAQLEVSVYCEKCSSDRKMEEPSYVVDFPKLNFDLTPLSGTIVTNILKYLALKESALKIATLDALPCCASHIAVFHTENSANIWVEVCGDEDEKVRKKFVEVLGSIIKQGFDNSSVSEITKNEIIEIFMSTLLRVTKKSLQETDFKLQESVLETIETTISVATPNMILTLIKMLIYLIMTPTSKHPFIAINEFFNLAKKQNMSITQIYKQYKQEICEVIVHLCAVNQALVQYSMKKSLSRISIALKFYSSEDFVSRECQHLLPYLVAKLVKLPQVSKLIEEIPLLTNSALSELVKTTYGTIFLHIFLNLSKDDFKKCMVYLERVSKADGPYLRKKNFWVILNELLLNFHEKREKVIIALTLFQKEDTESKFTTLQEYLQPRMLGLLQYFDIKLMAQNSHRKDMIFMSLADLFKFMGPKNVTPLRFKIIAMLRTADYSGFPGFICEVWDSFVRNCEVESLGPQLATIFVSLLPLIKICPMKTNNIFKYLVVSNEAKINEFIKDLFFVEDQKLDKSVNQVILKHVKSFEQFSLKDHIKSFLKYLSHETIEVRIRSFKALKVLMEKNREELDKMILGYNGIDPVLVDLIDILMVKCREKDRDLKLVCGEVIGELGAVEPAHLPRRYAQDSQNFTFFINDDAFIVNVLNELARASQGEKNTINMDRFAVAIQEILKFYEISPEPNASRNYLWNQFSESQQELMLPLLTSKYIISQNVKANISSPIYGTSDGASFNSWIYNWTASLISALPQEKQNLLSVCLPAMKQDQKILMQFLPYVVLHSVIDNVNQSREKSFIEIKTVTSAFTKQEKIDQKFLDLRPFPIPGVTAIIDTITPEEVKQAQCTRVVFVVLDFLDRWVREWQFQKGLPGKNDPNFVNIKSFLVRFCKLQLAKCNYNCGEYPRALMYLEDYITENPHEISSQLSFLAEIYAHLDEPDGVAGVMALQHTEPSIEQRILALEVSGKLSEAAFCYERMPPPLKLQHIRGLIQCYLDLDNVNTALSFAQGAIDLQPQFGNMLMDMQAEPLWRLGQYEDLDNLLQKPAMRNSTSWRVQIGKALLSFQKGHRAGFGDVLESLKMQEIDFLSATSVQQGSYQHGYEFISRLHALNELRQVEKACYEILLNPNDSTSVANIINNLYKEWELRIKVVQESVRIIEPLLCLRRVALEQSKRILSEKVPSALPLINSLLGELWLLSSKTARSAGVHQQAYTYNLKAEEYAPPELFLEKAELHWLREEHEQALTTLHRGIEKILPEQSQEATNSLPRDKRKLVAKAKLLIATYNDSISNFDTEVIKGNYKAAIEAYKECEKSWVSCGQFYDRTFQMIEGDDIDNDRGSELQLHMIHCFGKSLAYGTTYVYQSLPRLLSIWFDYGTRLLDARTAADKEDRKIMLLKMTKLVDSFLEQLPSYIFLTAFSQLVSRICHPQKEVCMELKSIIVKLLVKYPQQTLWMMIPVIKSSYSVRAKHCADILADSRLKTITMSKLIKDFTTLAEKLIELCNKEVPQDVETITVSQLQRGLPRMLNKDDFSEIMIPIHKFRKLVLPNPDFSSSQHNPFPNHYVHIIGIDEEITLLRSLQRPRKITLRGSDGKAYVQMLKPKDDLRKDFRLMEFNDIVNQLLSREPEARQRRLNIRLYSVSPLNEECGLIEWIPNLVGLRPILTSIYKQKGTTMSSRELREAACNIRDPLSKKRDVFTKVLLPRHPPVLGEWFRRTFPDAQTWVFARTAYTRTVAVMSMVGYILGLGDRHGENILLDSICGDAVHVDFNCLFNKGESFEWPERVPFRLTHNMVAAMGPLGAEGVFRKSCACTLRVLRSNSNILMSIVTPFVYDPLVSWPRHSKAGTNTAERTNEQAVDHVKNIELRLKGIIKTRSRNFTIPLSVEGQSNSLIKEAMSVDNLCQMFIGWGAYL